MTTVTDALGPAVLVAMLVMSPHAQSASTGSAQAFPNRPVRILVPLTSGGNMDTMTRALAQKLGDAFSQNVIVDNRPGAGSQIALEILASSAPDGHTLMMSSLTPVTHPLLYKSRFDLLHDFEPVSQVAAQGYVLTVYPAVPAKSVSELVQHLRANPGKLNFMSTGIGSPIHLTGELFQVATGTRMLHVPYRGAAYQDIASGLIQVGFPTVTSVLPYLQSGRLRPLAVTTPQRMPALPDLPTFAEAGVKGMIVVNWYGLIAPGRTPKAVTERIAKETKSAMHSPEMTRRLAAESSEPVGSSPSEFAAHIRAEHEQWSRVIKQAGIRGE
ncbi:MAG: Bug family tripartite tricarboxylate transporter substrate binding protein [Burkholderiales bacterium]